jgi:hypothetical protein
MGGGLDAPARRSTLKGAVEALGLSQEEVERAALRLLVERARLLALPAALRSRCKRPSRAAILNLDISS